MLTQSSDSNKITLKVRSTCLQEDFQIKANLEDTAADLGEKVLSELNKFGQHVRLISSGKLLQPAHAKLRDFNLTDGSYVHAVLSDQVRNPSALPPPPTESPIAPIDLSRLRGLDRLLTNGMQVDEVAAIRSAFRPQIAQFSTAVARLDGESSVDYMSRVEELWMLAQSSDSEFAMNLPRTLTPAAHTTNTGTIYNFNTPLYSTSSMTVTIYLYTTVT